MTDQTNNTTTEHTGDEAPLVLTKLEIQAVKRIRVARFRPGNRAVVTIGGKNGHGKSSVLDSFEMLIGGKDAVPAEPIHRGKRRGDIVGTLGTRALGDQYVLHRIFTANGGTELKVSRADGGRIEGGPQGFIEDLFGKNKTLKALASDPLAFATMDPTEQDKLCKLACGVDFTEIDARRDKADAERAAQAKVVKQLEGQLIGLKEHIGVPSSEVSVADLTMQLEHHTSIINKTAGVERDVDASNRIVASHQQRIDDTKREIARLRDELLDAETRLESCEREMLVHRSALETANAKLASQRAADEAATSAAESVRKALATVQDTNAKVRENIHRAEVQKKLDEAREELERIKMQREQIDLERKEMLDNAKYPIPGMGFDETGPTLDGFPLEQASQAQKIRLGVAIGCELNPGIGVFLIRQGSLLDDESMLALEQELIARQCQALVEVVSSDGDGCAIYLQDGEIVERPAAAEQAQPSSGP